MKVAKHYIAVEHDSCRPHLRRQLVHNKSPNWIILAHHFLEQAKQFTHRRKLFAPHERIYIRKPDTHAVRYQEGTQLVSTDRILAFSNTVKDKRDTTPNFSTYACASTSESMAQRVQSGTCAKNFEKILIRTNRKNDRRWG
ncbi:hypothetical protein CSKR_101384 [Clonorchis sinensis]|uniref:Uncharacterized protein n=1 Tax=Clonorchis sinensis TaxID=79923 RepID=A0A419PI22_CLOSI|nr:hypothetical protein CSKR_101384 [Clonorchis sinensis]